MALYELALMGAPSAEQSRELEQQLSQLIRPFGLHLGQEVGWSICPAEFEPPNKTSAAVAFVGGIGVSEAGIRKILQNGIPVLPISSADDRIHDEIPAQLRPLNCVTYRTHGPQRISTALLECVGLLPRQRRVFVSYRRNEAGAAALQLFDALSARLFDVFLDTHGIAPAEDFQSVLWHRLCDSDVLVMIDTPAYFGSRWTSAEFGRALAKGISVLRIGWPGLVPSPRISTASRVDLAAEEIDAATGRLTDVAIARICIQLESVRSQSHAVRNLNLFSNLQQAVQCIGGTVAGVGLHRAVFITLPDGRDIVVYPTVGVPTSVTLHNAIDDAPDRSVAVVYDHVGLHPNWLRHLEWLGDQIKVARWVKASEAAWSFAAWEVLP
jgi:TIR domain